jgi:hypothetical protein
MIRFRSTGTPRRLALIVALLFAAITLLASRPHSHGGPDFPTSKAGTTAAFSSDPGNCLLCSWLTTSYVTPTVAATVFLVLALPVAWRYSISAASLCSRPTPRRGLRAPPFSLFH